MVYSPLTTWGKMRAFALAPERATIYQTMNLNLDNIGPRYRVSRQGSYQEHLFDGPYLAHNPYADHPLASAVFDTTHVARFVPTVGGRSGAADARGFPALASAMDPYLPKRRCAWSGNVSMST